MYYRFITAVLLIVMASCNSAKKLTKDMTYFNEGIDTAATREMASYEPRIQKGDQLSIKIFSANEKINELYNINNTTGSSVAGQSSGGYLVDESGDIRLPVIGKVQAAGLTKKELEERITSMVRPQLQEEPLVTVNIINYKITVLGEVKSPGPYVIPNERVTILDAIGMAGDLTDFSRRDSIMVIREKDGQRTFGNINLTKGDVFNSPYYFLNQNDVVYVKPSNRKAINTDQGSFRRVTQYLSILSAIGVIVSLINVLK